MVRNVSHDMFFIYDILMGVEGQLMEDPNLYASYIKVEWPQLAGNAKNVLTILGAHSPATLFDVTTNLEREVRLRNTHRPLYMPIITNTMHSMRA